MQWHKRDSCTHSFWHQVFYIYCTSLLLPPSNILYRAQYKTTLCRKALESGAVRGDSVQGFHALLPLLLILQNLLVSFCDFPVHESDLCSESSVLFCFAVCVLFLRTLSLGFSPCCCLLVPLPHRVLSLSFFRWLKSERRNRMSALT